MATGRQTTMPCIVFLALKVPIFIGFIFLCTISGRKHLDHKSHRDGPTPSGPVAVKNPMFYDLALKKEITEANDGIVEHCGSGKPLEAGSTGIIN